MVNDNIEEQIAECEGIEARLQERLERGLRPNERAAVRAQLGAIAEELKTLRQSRWLKPQGNEPWIGKR